MRVYLAARYERQHEMRKYAEQLRAEGIEVISTWVEFESPSSDGFSGLGADRRALQAMLCVQQVAACNLVTVFSDVPHGPDPRGGKHFEMGAALALGKRVLLVGKPEHIFHELSDVEQYERWEECFARILDLRQSDAMTVRQAAREMHMIGSQIQHLINAGKLPAVKRAGRWVIGRNDLDRVKALRSRRAAEAS